MRILVIDDDPSARTLLSDTLTEEGHDVICCEDGHKAFDLIDQTYPFDAILCDACMPTMGGIEVLKKLKKEGYDYPVILITGHQDLQLAIDALQLGAFDFLLKPIEMKKLDRALNRVKIVSANDASIQEGLSYVVQDELRMVIHSDTKLVEPMVSIIQQRLKPICRKYQLSLAKLTLCLFEAISNAIVHGNLEVDSTIDDSDWELYDEHVRHQEAIPELQQKEVEVCLSIFPESLEVTVQNEGKSFQETADHGDLGSLSSPSGRGLLLIESFVDEVLWEENGNRIRLVKYFDSAAVSVRY